MSININQHNINFPEEIDSENNNVITVGEFFAGGGGWTAGCENVPGIKTKWILNHDSVAIYTNQFHHKNVKVYWADVYAQDEHELEKVDHVHASIECTQHSKANGGNDKKIGSYTMGWELVRYIRYLLPNSISIENVPEFKKWSPLDECGHPSKELQGIEFERWKNAIMELGYEYTESIRNAADDGIPTTRVRYFAFFFRKEMELEFPDSSHEENGENKPKWVSCKNYIDLENHGESIFGRKFNENLPKHLRKPLSENSLKRIAAGIRKFIPDFNSFITSYYGATGNEFRWQLLDKPLATVTTANRHQLVNLEKFEFITDHCHVNYADLLTQPLRTQTTRQTKQKITVSNFLCQYYGTIQIQSLEKPIATCTTKDRHQLIRVEKTQFIAKYFNSNGNPGANVESIEKPLSPVLTEFKHQLITFLDEFDIKARFLKPEELAECSSFPRDYFSKPGLKLSGKNAVKMIGNAVPPMWAEKLMSANLNSMIEYKKNNYVRK